MRNKLKRIGILEYHYHSIFYYTLAKICRTKHTQVTLFTTKKIFSLISSHFSNKKDYRIVLQHDKESLASFLHRVETICNANIDLLFINTIQESLKDLPHYVRFHPSCKMILTIHDANTWLNQKITIDITRPFATLDTLLSTLLINKIILRKFDAINVIYPPIKNYILKNTNYQKEIFTLPFTFFDEKKYHFSTELPNKIRFVVPGAIIESRRDHTAVMDAFEHLFDSYPHSFSLYLLGKPIGSYGKQILKRAEQLKQQKYDIHFFSEFVPEEIYDKIFREATVVIAPIKLNTRSLGVMKETFGETKASGVLFDAIQYAKPIVLPFNHSVMKELASSTLIYRNAEDLYGHLSTLLSDKKTLTTLVKNASKNSLHFSLSNMQHYFQQIVLPTFKL